ncbi:hypothetical protein DB32_006949 [Sandaracinus amylolyticus]|uniref:Uncharacterized protein n=1 Tax=Sandaracinus amylolyticus TaxID=927083 RepID=A0A0F6W809_9BACT|nr:hypothetical protein DB32_006949 [Sandaracinus amylolyticus]
MMASRNEQLGAAAPDANLSAEPVRDSIEVERSERRNVHLVGSGQHTHASFELGVTRLDVLESTLLRRDLVAENELLR